MVLELHVWGEYNSVLEKREQNLRHASNRRVTEHIFTGWQIGWAPSKQRASDVTTGWNDKIDDTPLNTMIKEVLLRGHKEDLVRGRWWVDGQALSVWVDASSLTTGMSLVYDAAVVEDDACWLRPKKNSRHINLAELDAIIKGINLAILWKTTTLHLFTDSACVHKWISDTLTSKARG